MAKDFGIKKWPSLIVQNQFATPDDDSSEGHHVFSGKMKLAEIIDFVTPFALSENEKKDEKVISSKTRTSMNQQTDVSGYKVLSSVTDLEDKFLEEHWASLVYVAKQD